MKRYLSLLLLLPLMLAVPLSAMADEDRNERPERYDYPTMDRYQWIEECMYRQQSRAYETLYACGCAIDVIAEHLPHETFISADTAEKAAGVSGESGEYLRSPDISIQELRIAYGEAKNEADKRCFVRPNRMKGIWPDF